MSSIVTDLDRKRTKELRLYRYGMFAAGILLGATLAWVDQSRFGTTLRFAALAIPVSILIFCLWRFDSITSCSSYCPDEPIKKD